MCPHCGIPRSWDDSFYLENFLYPIFPQTDCFLHQPGYVERCSLSFSPRDNLSQRQQKVGTKSEYLNNSSFWDSNLVFPRFWMKDEEIGSLRLKVVTHLCGKGSLKGVVCVRFISVVSSKPEPQSSAAPISAVF